MITSLALNSSFCGFSPFSYSSASCVCSCCALATEKNMANSKPRIEILRKVLEKTLIWAYFGGFLIPTAKVLNLLPQKNVLENFGLLVVVLKTAKCDDRGRRFPGR